MTPVLNCLGAKGWTEKPTVTGRFIFHILSRCDYGSQTKEGEEREEEGKEERGGKEGGGRGEGIGEDGRVGDTDHFVLHILVTETDFILKKKKKKRSGVGHQVLVM